MEVVRALGPEAEARSLRQEARHPRGCRPNRRRGQGRRPRALPHARVTQGCTRVHDEESDAHAHARVDDQDGDASQPRGDCRRRLALSLGNGRFQKRLSVKQSLRGVRPGIRDGPLEPTCKKFPGHG